jgi:hypothetical protein
MNIRASKASYGAENARSQNKGRNKAHHVSKKESHFLRPTVVDRANLHGRSTRSRAQPLRRRFCGGASVDVLNHIRSDLLRVVGLASIPLNVRLVSRQDGAKIQRSQSDHCPSRLLRQSQIWRHFVLAYGGRNLPHNRMRFVLPLRCVMMPATRFASYRRNWQFVGE